MITNVISATAGTFFFGFLFNIRGKKLYVAAIGGGVGILTYEIIARSSSSVLLAFFCSAIVFGAYSEIMARIMHTPVTSFAISGMIPLVPGKGMYMTMIHFVEGNLSLALDTGLETLASAGVLAFGIMFVSTIAKLISEYRKKADI